MTTAAQAAAAIARGPLLSAVTPAATQPASPPAISLTSPFPIVFLDTETTSINPDRRVWEVAMIRRDPTGQVEHRFFVKNVDLSNADPFALKVGGFYDRHPQYNEIGGPVVERYEAAQKVERVTRGALIAGAVPSFDTETLAKMLRSVNLTPAWDYHLVDLESMALGWLSAQGITPDIPWRSEAIALQCGVEPATDTDRHTALGDARWVMRWYETITAKRAGR